MVTGLENGLGLDIVIWLQAHGSPLLDVLAQVLNITGGAIFALVAGPLIYWTISKRLGLHMLLLMLVGALASALLKEIAHTPRPFVAYPDQVDPLFDVGGYGLPSGHVMNAITFWLPAVVTLRDRRWWGVYGVYVLLMAWGRMYAGVHYPQDIIGSLIVGGLLGWGYLRWRPEADALRHRGLIAGMLLLPWILLSFLAGYDDGVTVLGGIFGFGVGLVGEQRYVNFAITGSLAQRAWCYATGLAVLFALFLGLDALFGTAEPAHLLRLLRYAAVTAFGIALWPAVWPALWRRVTGPDRPR